MPLNPGQFGRPLIAASYLLVAILALAGCGTGVSAVTAVTNRSTTGAGATTRGSSSGSVTAPITGQAPTAKTAALPNFDHIYVILMENKETSQVVGSGNAPYINSLIGQFGVATNYTGVSHPSQPNYLALWSGSTHGITDDNVHNLTGTTIADQLDTAGKSWSVFAENYPVAAPGAKPTCFTGASSQNGEDGSGSYARKHDPAVSFTSVNTNVTRCSQHINDFTHFNASAVDFSFIVPNLCHDMHDCSVSSGDNWLKQWLPQHILNTTTWKNSNSAIFITWDEGETSTGGGGNVPLIVISHRTPAGYVSQTRANHYALLRTIEDIWGLGCLQNSCDAADLSGFFQNDGTGSATATPTTRSTATPPGTATATKPPVATGTATKPPVATTTPTKTPTGTPVATTTLNFAPSGDAYVTSSEPNSVHGTGYEIPVDGSPIRIGYFTFNLSGLSGSIVTAQLTLTVTTDGSSTGGSVGTVSDTSWTEATLTYNNRPSVSPPIASIGNAPEKQMVTVDVTQAITGNGVFGLAISSTNADGVTYSSRESASSPVLTVTIGRSYSTSTTTTMMAPR